MTNVYTQFTASVPQNYDRYLGMVLFDPFAKDLARRIPKDSKRILETACGSGIVTRRILQSLPAGASLVATDLNAPMVEHARAMIRSDSRVTWRTADMCDLGVPDRSFDAVVCQFGVMFVPDKLAAFREALRVLVPGGPYVFNVWDSLARNRFATLANEVIAGFFPTDPPGFYQVPFSMADVELVRSLLDQAGFQDVRETSLDLETTSPSADEFAKGLIEGNPVVAEIQTRGGVSIDDVRSRLAGRIRAEMGDRPVSTRLRATVYEASVPR
jgi:ubiquinone/menaquinone biosynthesis C-methylase UbiE